MNGLAVVLMALLPSIGVGLLFWVAMRAVVNADRTERQAMARMDLAERAAAAGRDADDNNGKPRA